MICTAADLGLAEEIHVCPVAETASAAVPYTTLAAMKDKSKVSVWPCSSFDVGADGSVTNGDGPQPTPASAQPPAPTSAPLNARDLARQRALQRNANASPDARVAARERAKARAAAAKAAANGS